MLILAENSNKYVIFIYNGWIHPEPDEQKDTVRRKKTIKYIVLVQQHYNNNFVVQYTVSWLHITFYFALPTEYQGSSYIQYTTSVSAFHGLTTRQVYNKF